MSSQKTARIVHPGWTTVTRKNARAPRKSCSTIDPQIAATLAKNWAMNIKNDKNHPINVANTLRKERKAYPYSQSPGETWADDIERAEENGWVSGWPLSTQAKRRIQPQSWSAATKCISQ